MDLVIDHVPFAWSDLDALTTEFERLGLAPEYGGVHANELTHMSVLGFPDRTYVELISERREGTHDFWPRHIRADAGPAAWCVRVDDVAAACERAIDAGVPVNGPLYGAREREDGTLAEWDRAEIGRPGERSLFPFVIADRTPIEYRVTPTESVADGPLTGVGQAVVAVESLDEAIESFRLLYRFPRPRRATVEGFGPVASFPGQPLALVGDDEDWIRRRLDRFGPGPCACLLATDDLDAAAASYSLREELAWPDGRVAAFDSEPLGSRLGVIER